MPESQRPDDGTTRSDTQKQEVTLPTPVKEKLSAVITEAMERIVSVANQVKAAKETSEQLDKPVPEELSSEIEAISGLLSGLLSRYPSPTAGAEPEGQQAPSQVTAANPDGQDGPAGEASSALKDFGEAVIALAATVTGDTLSDDAVGQLRPLAARLNKLVEGEEQKADPAHVDIEDITDEEFFAALDRLGGLPTEVSHKFKVLAEAMTRIADAPDPVSLMNIRDQMVGVSKALEDRVEKAEPEAPAEPAQPEPVTLETLAEHFAKLEALAKRALEGQVVPPERADGDMGNVGSGPPGDRPAAEDAGPLQEIMKRLQRLDRQVADLGETPDSPASRPESPSTPTGATGTRRRGGPWIL